MSTQIETPKNKTSNGLIILLALLAFGLVIGGFGYYKLKIGKESLSWPSVTGKITFSRVNQRRDNKKTKYDPSVSYSYFVSGTTYSGNHISSSDMSQKTRSRANAILEKYPVGAQVPVYYNPSDPTKALLEPGIKTNVYFLLALAGGCLLLAVSVFVSLLKHIFQKRGADG